MSYVAGFVVAVPSANKDAYVKHANEWAPFFHKLGVTRMVEAWDDDVPQGKDTDFQRSVKLEQDETVVFSWQEYPSRAVADDAEQKMQADPAMQQMGDMPFDGKRMIYGGFEVLLDERKKGASAAQKPAYVDGALLPVAAKDKDAYVQSARKQTALLLELGALRVVDTWGENVTDGKVTDFNRAVKAKEGEKVVFSWVEWPSKAVRDAAWKTFFERPDAHSDEAIVDESRRVWGGFQPVVEA